MWIDVDADCGTVSCLSRCKALASWSVNKPIKLVGSVANRKPGIYNARFRRVVRQAKTTGLIAACRRACQSGFGSDGVGNEMRGNGIVTPFPRMDLPSAVFTAARVNKQKMTKRVQETKDAHYTENVMSIVRGSPPSHARSKGCRIEYPQGAFQPPVAMHFEVSYETIKLLQCITTKHHFSSCCDAEDGRGRMFLRRAIVYMRRIGLKHRGIQSCRKPGNCWSWQSPPVACDVKKSLQVEKICLTHIQKGLDVQTKVAVTQPDCWYPLKDKHKPRPFSMAGDVDWRTGNGTKTIVKRGCGNTRNCAWDPIWGCSPGTSCKQYRCEHSKYALDREWVKTRFLTN